MKIQHLFEAELKPGQRKGMSLKLTKLEKMLKKINDYQDSASGMHNMKVPDSVSAEYEKVKQGIHSEIERLNLEKDQFKTEKNNLPVKFYNLMQGIAKNCTEIVKVYTDLNPDFKTSRAKALYRGIKSSDDALYGKPFDDRRVMTSNSRITDIFNKGMEAAGFEARRDNSSFVSGDKGQASGYGKLYVMFPKDGFSFSWSKNTKDLILGTGSYPKMLDYQLLAPLKDFVLANQENLEAKYRYLNFGDLFGEYDLASNLKIIKQAIEAGDVPEEFLPLTDLENVMTPEAIVKGFELDKEDLTGAIASGNEVFIRGAYYAVQESLMKDIMKFLELQVYPEGKPRAFKKDEYEIGDRVTVKKKNNSYYGKSGTVTYIYSGHSEITVQLDGEHWTKDFAFNAVKHESDTDPETPDPEYGDLVKITDSDSSYYGRSGTVTYAYNDDRIEVTFKNGDYGVVKTSQVKILDPNNPEDAEEKSDNDKIKKGDQVKIIGKHPNAGVNATVDEIYDFYKDTVLILDNGEKLYNIPLANLEKVGTVPKSLEIGQVKYGDAVKIIGDHKSAGKTGKVSYAYSTVAQVDVELDSGITHGVELKNIEKIKPDEEPAPDVDINMDDLEWEPEPEVGIPPIPKPAAFIVGDEIIITGTWHHGETGTIQEINKVGGINVKLKNGDTTYLYPNEIKKIETPEPAPAVTTAFNTGDSVKIINGPDTGKIGKITYVSKTLKIADIKFTDGTSNTLGFNLLQKLDFPISNNLESNLEEILSFPEIKGMIAKAKQSGFVTTDQFNSTVSPDASDKDREDLKYHLLSLGIALVDKPPS